MRNSGFQRILDINNLEQSAFLFGPRMTGKTTLLKKWNGAALFDLLDPGAEMRYRARPELLWEEFQALPDGSRIAIDEIQKIPTLLDCVQMGIDRKRQIFLLSGSSARKLRRGGANLLGGRALDLRLHPLCVEEIGFGFRIEKAMKYGTLPFIQSRIQDGQQSQAVQALESYVGIYLKEEIQAEAMTRNVGAFQRFLAIAAQCNGQVIEFSNISREASVPASTVKEYFQILEDTLIGQFLWPYHHSERKKARPKFNLFDCGVVRALQNRIQDEPTPMEKGFLFETWLLGEFRRIRDYHRKPHRFSFWRVRDQEIDILVEGPRGPLLAVECKSARTDVPKSHIDAFRREFPNVPIVVASLTDERPRKVGDLEILPWKNVVERYTKL